MAPCLLTIFLFASISFLQGQEPPAPAAVSASGKIRGADPKLRLDGVSMLRADGSPEALKALASLAEDPDPEVRRAVIEAIPSCVSAEGALEWLCERSLRLGSVEARSTQILALRNIPAPLAAKTLVAFLEDPAPELRIASVLALAGHPESGAEALPRFVELAARPPWRVQAAVVGTLAAWSGAGAFPGIEERLERERGERPDFGRVPSGIERALAPLAARALAGLPLPRDLDLQSRAERALIALAGWPGAVADHAWGDADPARLVWKEVSGAVSGSIREAAVGSDTQPPSIGALRAMGMAGRVDVMLAVLDSPAPDPVRREVAQLIGQRATVGGWTPDEAVALSARLRKAFPKEKSGPRPHVAAALAALDVPDRAEMLSELRKHEDWRVGAAIDRVLRPPPASPTAPGEVPPLFSTRWGAPRKEALARFGGTSETEAAVLRALDWLARQQEKDGSWSCAAHNPEHRRGRIPGMDREDEYVDAGVTGLAIMAFFGAGYTHQGDDTFAPHIRHAIDWLLRIQQRDGRFDLDPARTDLDPSELSMEMRVYNHNIPLFALLEAYAVTRDPALKAPLERALDHAGRSKDPQYGWSRSLVGDDIGPTIYYLQALPLAKSCGFPVPPALESEALAYLTRITDLRRRQIRALSAVPVCYGGYDSSATGMVAWMWMGRSPTSAEVEALAKTCEPHGVVWEPHFDVPKVRTGRPEEMLWNPDDILNEWYWYYGTLAFRERGGAVWPRWNAQLQEALLGHQRPSGDDAGAWDSEGAWGRIGGRVYMTAFGAMSLEGYYQYNR